MMYAIAERKDWQDGPVARVPGMVLIAEEGVREYVREVTGRDVLGYQSVRVALNRGSRVYAAGGRGMPNIIIERVKAGDIA